MSVFTDPTYSSVAPVVTAEVVGAPLSGEVESWEISRELVGSTLPGNLRARSGLSVGSGSCVVRNPNPLVRTPWGKPADRIRNGMSVSLLATSVLGETWAMGDWLVAKSSGSLRSQQVPLELYESAFRARGAGGTVRNLLPVMPATPCEPAWMVDALARQVGWYSTPPMVESALASLPLNGALWSENHYLAYPDVNASQWGGVRGVLGPVGDWRVYVPLDNITYEIIQDTPVPTLTPALVENIPLYLTLDIAGGPVLFQFNGGLYSVQVRVSPGLVEVKTIDSAAWQSVAYTPGLDPNHPQRVQIELQRGGSRANPSNEYDFTGYYGPTRARARSAHDAPWTAWATDPTTSPVLVNPAIEVFVSSGVAMGGSAAGIQITWEADPALWARNTAHISALGAGGQMLAPWLPASTDVWTGIQETAAAWLGAVHLDRHGDLWCRDRDYLAGNVPPEDLVVIDVGQRVEDLPWALDPADEADRLEVSYSPVDILVPRYDPDAEHWDNPDVKGYAVSPLLWEASEAVLVQAGETVTIDAEVNALAVAPGAFIAPYGKRQYWSTPQVLGSDHWQESTWQARGNRDGTGPVPPDGALEVTSDQISAGLVRVTITNRTGGDLWTVDSNGDPWLRMRVAGMASQDTTALVTRGVSAELAQNPMKIDLGRMVQRKAEAEAVADYIWARAQNPGYAVDEVGVVPDFSRDIAQVALLVHERSGLSQKALIVKDMRAGKAGQVSQRHKFVMLPTTYADLRAAWAGRAYADLETAWAGETYADMTDEPLKGA